MQQCKGNYMQNTYPIEDLYPEYAKNSEKDNRPTQKQIKDVNKHFT